MAQSSSFQADVRDNVTSVLATASATTRGIAELTTFRDALADVGTGSRADRIAAWNATYRPRSGGRQSLAYELRKAIRDQVNADADADGGVGPLERESVYRTLIAELVPVYPKPLKDADEHAELQRLLTLAELE